MRALRAVPKSWSIEPRRYGLRRRRRSLDESQNGDEMNATQESRPGWSIQEAEELMTALTGVVSARIVSRPGGEIDEIHLLTTDEVTAKQTVRNVESALLAHLGMEIDHRKVSVAQTKDRPAQAAPAPSVHIVPAAEPLPEPDPDDRILFESYQLETERSHQIRHKVELSWRGESFVGEVAAADLPRAKLEAVVRATLAAMEAAVASKGEQAYRGRPLTLALDGVKLVEAFDRQFVMVAVHAMAGRQVNALAGATVVEESADRAAILAALQATDRWVRGKM